MIYRRALYCVAVDSQLTMWKLDAKVLCQFCKEPGARSLVEGTCKSPKATKTLRQWLTKPIREALHTMKLCLQFIVLHTLQTSADCDLGTKLAKLEKLCLFKNRDLAGLVAKVS